MSGNQCDGCELPTFVLMSLMSFPPILSAQACSLLQYVGHCASFCACVSSCASASSSALQLDYQLERLPLVQCCSSPQPVSPWGHCCNCNSHTTTTSFPDPLARQWGTRSWFLFEAFRALAIQCLSSNDLSLVRRGALSPAFGVPLLLATLRHPSRDAWQAKPHFTGGSSTSAYEAVAKLVFVCWLWGFSAWDMPSCSGI
jgi:hypothetical protein